MKFFTRVSCSLIVMTPTFYVLLSPDPYTAQLSVKVFLSHLDPFFSSHAHLWASSARKCNDFILMPHRSLFTPDVPPVQVKSLPRTSTQKLEPSSSFNVTNRAVCLCPPWLPNTASCLLTMDITPICLFLSPSLYF